MWRETTQPHRLCLFQEVPEGCEQVLAGRRLMQCLADPNEVKMALEVYKLSLEIELLELQRDKARNSVQLPL